MPVSDTEVTEAVVSDVWVVGTVNMVVVSETTAVVVVSSGTVVTEAEVVSDGAVVSASEPLPVTEELSFPVTQKQLNRTDIPCISSPQRVLSALLYRSVYFALLYVP